MKKRSSTRKEGNKRMVGRGARRRSSSVGFHLIAPAKRARFSRNECPADRLYRTGGKLKPRLRDLSPSARGNQDAESRNPGPSFLTAFVRGEGRLWHERDRLLMLLRKRRKNWRRNDINPPLSTPRSTLSLIPRRRIASRRKWPFFATIRPKGSQARARPP